MEIKHLTLVHFFLLPYSLKFSIFSDKIMIFKKSVQKSLGKYDLNIQVTEESLRKKIKQLCLLVLHGFEDPTDLVTLKIDLGLLHSKPNNIVCQLLYYYSKKETCINLEMK